MSKEEISPEEIEQAKANEQPTEAPEKEGPEPSDEAKENQEYGEAESVNPIEDLEQKIQDEKDRYLRLYAEFENFRRRNAKERIDLIQSASADLMKELLSVLDDFERAQQSNEKADDIDTVKEGFNILQSKLVNILKSKGLTALDSLKEEFNPEIHEAIARVEGDQENKGKVIDVVEKGYKLNDKLIRHPKVVVGS